MKYYLYLIYLLVMYVVAWSIQWIFPAFAEMRFGNIDNANATGFEPRLPLNLAMFDTPDNSLLGDNNWHMKHGNSYWGKVAWLYRNTLYGFKWTTLACKVEDASQIVGIGNPKVNRNNGITGTFKATYKDYWQYKIVKKLYGDFGIMWNFGWQLDEFYHDGKSGMALFQFSPRLVKIK